MPKHFRNPIEQYLATYAEPEAHDVASLDLDHHRYCLVIPAYQEDWQKLQVVWKNLDKNCLIILVINAPVADDATTNKLVSDAETSTQILGTCNALTVLKDRDQRTILLVNRCKKPIPIKQGVGLARKIGADIALTLINNSLLTAPWIFNTDADVRLPETYLNAVAGKPVDPGVAARIYPFTHVHTPGTFEACTLYEISLYYYVCGLRFAGSPYAFTTVGSTIAIAANHYAKVRGFPKRPAGEDFYLLNKLAKTGSIDQMAEPLLEISGRLSDRVPFGTGTGIKKILDLSDPVSEYRFYNPGVFHCLKQFLLELDHCQSASDITRHFGDPKSTHWCESVNLFKLIESKQNQKPEIFRKFIFDWMDGFRALKFIHFLQHHYLEPVTLGEIFDGSILPSISPSDLSDLTQAGKLVTIHRQQTLLSG